MLGYGLEQKATNIPHTSLLVKLPSSGTRESAISVEILIELVGG